MPNRDWGNAPGATKSELRPGEFPLGSEQSRAAARFLLTARNEAPHETLRIVVGRTGPRSLENCDCIRTLCQDGTLLEVVGLHGGNLGGLSDEELDEWVARFPVEGL